MTLKNYDMLINKLLNNAVNNQYSELDAKNLLKFILMRKAKNKKKTILFLLLFLVTLILIFLNFDSFYRSLIVIIRLVLIQLLPYWDWTLFYQNDCLILNFFQKPEFSELNIEDCKKCSSHKYIEKVENITSDIINDFYLNNNIPFLVKNSTSTWPASSLFDTKFLIKLYKNDDILHEAPVCMINSSIALRHTSINELFSKVLKSQSWFAHWENCEKSSVRILRRYFKRPVFLPQSIHIADLNWIILSSSYNASNYFRIELGMDVMWMVQLSGQNRIRLIANYPCYTECNTLYSVLHQGDIVVWTYKLWTLEYIPTSSPLNVAVAFGGFY